MNSLVGKVSPGILLFFTLATAAAASPVSVLSKAEPGLLDDSAGGFLGTYGSFDSPGRQVSADGRYVAFLSSSSHLVPGQVDTNQGPDIFLRDRVAGTTVLVSRSAVSGTTTANAHSSNLALSADGRWVAFVSTGTDFVSGQVDPQTEGSADTDIFLFDRTTGMVRLISHAAGSATTAADRGAGYLALSADGAYIAFASASTDLVAGQTGPLGFSHVFLHHRATDTTTLVSHAAGMPGTTSSGMSLLPSLSADGRYVSYTSSSSDLVAGATTSGMNIFHYDRTTGVNVLVSHTPASATTGGNNFSNDSRISADGRYVAFESEATDLAAGPANSTVDVFLWERDSGAVILVSHAATSPAAEANGRSGVLGISADGGWVLFHGWSTNLVAGQADANTQSDIFLFERATGAVTLVSHAFGSATTAGNFGTAEDGTMSGDGRYVAFQGQAGNYLAGPGESDIDADVFVYDRVTGAIILVSHSAGAAGTPADRISMDPEISHDAGTVVFDSLATDLASGTRDGNGAEDVYAYSLAGGTADLVSRHAPGMPSLTANRASSTTTLLNTMATSADGRWVAFTSSATNLVSGQVDTNNATDVFLHDRLAGTTVLVSRKAGASPATAARHLSESPVISGDGRYVAFVSTSDDLVAGQVDTGNYPDIFLFDRETGTVALASRAGGSATTAGDSISGHPSISADGTRVAFWSLSSNLGVGLTDTNSHGDVFLFDLGTGAVTLVSHTSGSPTTSGDLFSRAPRLSADGNFVTFEGLATNLVAGQVDSTAPANNDVFLYDVATGANTLVSHASSSPTTVGNGPSERPSLSADGSFVVFQSRATNLVAAGGFSLDQVYLFERATGEVRLVSHAAGSPTVGAYGFNEFPVISADGSWISFQSDGTNLIAGQVSGYNVYLQERATGARALVSHAANLPTTSANDYSSAPLGISGDGRYILYGSTATDLVWGMVDTPTSSFDLFLYDRDIRESVLVNRSLASPLQPTRLEAPLYPYLSTDGGTVVFTSRSSALAAGDYNEVSDVFAYDNGRVGSFHTIVPCRVLDTRQPQDGPALASGQTALLNLHGACGIPETAKALAANVTVVQPTGAGHVVFYRGDLVTAPAISTINFSAGQVRGNNTVLRLAANATGTLRVQPFVSGGGSVHVLIDLFGYFE